jgi:hypothetical protein
MAGYSVGWLVNWGYKILGWLVKWGEKCDIRFFLIERIHYRNFPPRMMAGYSVGSYILVKARLLM